jgi:Protein of unknown function (DUF3738)
MRNSGWVVAGLALASIRPDRSGDRGSSSQNTSPGARFATINISPMQLATHRFGVVGAQIEAPDWLSADRYDVTAKADISKEREALLQQLQQHWPQFIRTERQYRPHGRLRSRVGVIAIDHVERPSEN